MPVKIFFVYSLLPYSLLYGSLHATAGSTVPSTVFWYGFLTVDSIDSIRFSKVYQGFLQGSLQGGTRG